MESDREIVEYIVGDVKDVKNAPLLQLLSPSLQESSSIITQEVAIEYLSKHIILHSYPKEQKLTDDKIDSNPADEVFTATIYKSRTNSDWSRVDGSLPREKNPRIVLLGKKHK